MEEEPVEQEIQLQQEPIIVTAGGAVNSVNGQTGDVVLTTSDLANTSDYQTGSEVESAISSAVAIETSAREQADTNLSNSITNVSQDLQAEVTNRTNADAALNTSIADEALARQQADTNLQSQIDGITASSDVTDIVGTYAQLQAYDTSTLGNNDIIKVLQDESRNEETTYYRWSTTTQSFTLIGEEGPYYTKSQADALLNNKQNTLTAGTGISIVNNEISSTVSVPEVVQTIGTSTTSVMSQNAVTTQLDGLALKVISQTDYDALATKDPNTLYIITEA